MAVLSVTVMIIYAMFSHFTDNWLNNLGKYVNISNAWPIFWCHWSTCKRVTDIVLLFFCYVKPLEPWFCLRWYCIGNWFILVFSVDKVIYQHNETVYLVCHEFLKSKIWEISLHNLLTKTCSVYLTIKWGFCISLVTGFLN